jgi:hypothetical protein
MTCGTRAARSARKSARFRPRRRGPLRTQQGAIAKQLRRIWRNTLRYCALHAESIRTRMAAQTVAEKLDPFGQDRRAIIISPICSITRSWRRPLCARSRVPRFRVAG